MKLQIKISEPRRLKILPEEAETTALAEPKKKLSLFGSSSREIARKGSDAQDVSFGTTLPYGRSRQCL